ncbi:MAG: hypothetical protein M1836_001989 [Candelina mexicana]|nr:MAG: hypothetical protein M1836_001989 [Candelina mexicana]
MHHSTSSSLSSSSSTITTISADSNAAPPDLTTRALTIFHALRSPTIFPHVRRYIHPSIKYKHTPASPPSHGPDAYLQNFKLTKRRRSLTSSDSSDSISTINSYSSASSDVSDDDEDEEWFHMTVTKAYQHEDGGIWIYSQVLGRPGVVRRESVDVMRFNENGLLIESTELDEDAKDYVMMPRV